MRTILSLAFTVTSSTAFADTIIAQPEVTLSLPINEDVGSIVQMPAGVRTVTPSRFFQIVDLGADVDKASGQKVDVRTFQVTPAVAGKSESVTFILSNGKNLKVRLFSAKEGEKFYDLQMPQDSGKKDAKFMVPEMGLMRAMVRDEAATYARTITDEKVELPGSGLLSARILRVYAGQGLSGYVLKVTNESGKDLALNLSSLWLGTPNRAVAIQADKFVLSSCKSNETECATTLRIVARGNVNDGFGLAEVGNGKTPFVRESVGGANE